MSDTDSAFSAEENAYFESGGEGEVPEVAPAEPIISAEPPKPEEKQPEEKPQEDKRTVPLSELMTEKNRRREIDKQFRETQQQLAELKGKFSIIERMAPHEEAPKIPTPEEDIFGAVKHVGESVAQMEKRFEQQEAQAKETARLNQFVSAYQDDAGRFTKTTPDFTDAYKFLLNSRAEELKVLGYEGKALHDAIVADEYASAEMAFRQGVSPAERLYGLAKLRGYAAKAKDGNGQAAEALDRIEKGQAANKSLAAAGGATGEQGMTAQRLIDMPMAEFEAWCKKNPAAAQRIMSGGN